jgi:hypothetical protein
MAVRHMESRNLELIISRLLVGVIVLILMFSIAHP